MTNKKNLILLLLIIIVFIPARSIAQKLSISKKAALISESKRLNYELATKLSSIDIYKNEGHIIDTAIANSIETLFYSSRDREPVLPHKLIDRKNLFKMESNPIDRVIPVNQFVDSLIAWYCDKSCEVQFSSEIYPIGEDVGFEPYDWENAYIDPNYLFFNFYCTFYLYADFKQESRNDSIVTEGNKDINFDRYYNATITYRVKNWKGQEPEIKIYGIYEEIQKDIKKIISNHLRSQDRLFLDFDIGIGYNKSTCKYNIPHKPEESSYSINPVASLGISYFFNDGPQKITNGFSVGINYSTFQITSDNVTYIDSIQNQQDILSEDYTKLISGSNIKQTANLNLIGLYAAFKSKWKLKELSKSRLLNLYLSLGVTYSYIYNYVTSVEDSGSITYRGKYDFAFPGDISNYYILENIYDYGYYTTSDLQITENSNNTPKHAVSAYVTLGLGYEISNNWSFNISGKYNYGFMPGLSPVSNPYILSESSGIINNTFEYCESIQYNDISIHVGVTYLLKAKSIK